MRVLRGFVAAAVAILAACGGGPPPAGTTGTYLENTTWYVQSIDAARVTASLGEGPWMRVTSADGQVRGDTGCNQFNGPYRAGGTSVGFGPLATTRRACPDAARTEWERRILEVLQAADGYRISDGRLELMAGGRIRALFVAGPAR